MLNCEKKSAQVRSDQIASRMEGLAGVRNGYLHGGGGGGGLGARAVEAPGLGVAAAAAEGLGFSTKRLEGKWRMELYITAAWG
jgi:hypothetical protein